MEIVGEEAFGTSQKDAEASERYGWRYNIVDEFEYLAVGDD